MKTTIKIITGLFGIYFLFVIITGYFISPLNQIPMLGQEIPTKIYITNGTINTSKILLTDDQKLIQDIISDLESVWVTNMKSTPLETPNYVITFENNSNTILFPIKYYPKANIFEFPIENRRTNSKFSITSSDLLNQLWQEIESKKILTP